MRSRMIQGLAVLLVAAPTWAAPGQLAPFMVTQSNSNMAFSGPSTLDAAGAAKTAEFLTGANGIKGVFENVTTGDVAMVRHKPSGLICVDPRIVVTPKAPVTQFDPAMQAGCISRESGLQNNLMVIANSAGLPADQALIALLAHERTVWPALKGDGTRTSRIKSRGSHPAFVSANLTSTAVPGPAYVRLTVAAVTGWIVFDEVIGTPDQAGDCDRISETRLKEAVASVTAGR